MKNKIIIACVLAAALVAAVIGFGQKSAPTYICPSRIVSVKNAGGAIQDMQNEGCTAFYFQDYSTGTDPAEYIIGYGTN